MRSLPAGVFLPSLVVRLDIDALEPVPGHDVKLAHRAVVFRWVSRRHDDPSARNAVAAEDLVLQELQHGGCQCFGHAVDLVEEQNSLLHAGAFHHVVDRRNDLGHGIFGYAVFLSAVELLFNIGQTERRLAGVVGHGIADQTHTKLRRDLLHNSGLADARRSHQKHRPLALDRDLIIAKGVF